MNPMIYLLGAILIVGALFDILWRRIPNWLTVPAVAVGLAYHLWVAGLSGLLSSLAGAGLALALWAPFYVMGGIGAGDVKLMAAIGALLGPAGLFFSAVCSAVVGGVYAAVILAASRAGREAARGLWQKLGMLMLTQDIGGMKAAGTKKGPLLYYGVAIAIGTFLYLAGSGRFSHG